MWICKQAQPPTAADADVHGCVMVWHVIQGVMVYQWHLVMRNDYITHWGMLPAPPAAESH